MKIMLHLGLQTLITDVMQGFDHDDSEESFSLSSSADNLTSRLASVQRTRSAGCIVA